jgi:hypothetical protein
MEADVPTRGALGAAVVFVVLLGAARLAVVLALVLAEAVLAAGPPGPQFFLNQSCSAVER